MPAQRWRLTFARTIDSPDLQAREQTMAWDAVTDAVATDAPERPRLIHGAPLPNRMTADRELADLLLPVRWTIGPLRDVVADTLPAGYHLLDLHDVWLGEPSLPSLVIGADYRITVMTGAGEPTAGTTLDAAVQALLASSKLDRSRAKSGRTVVDNLRPLIGDVRALSPTCLWMRLRFDPVLGTGRPEDVIDALSRIAAVPIEAGLRHRERLWLRGQLDL